MADACQTQPQLTTFSRPSISNGYPLFDPVASAGDDSADVFFCTASEADTRGQMTEEGFVVLKGSSGRREPVPSLKEMAFGRTRERLIATDVIRVDSNRIVFEKDYLFKSPSAAATTVTGGGSNVSMEAFRWTKANGMSGLGFLSIKSVHKSSSAEDVSGDGKVIVGMSRSKNIVLDLRTKLDGFGYYDEPEIDRVVTVELDPKATQKQLEAAISPVADRLLKKFSAAQADSKAAEEAGDDKAASAAKDVMNSLIMFRTDITTYQRAYTFLSQIFDYGNTDYEKRAIFFKYLIRLLKFGREREGVDLSEVVLTHHRLRNQGKQDMRLKDDKYPELKPASEMGTGTVRESKKAYHGREGSPQFRCW